MRFQTFRHLLTYWAETAPDKPAILYDGAGRSELSCAQLLEAAEQRAAELRSGGKTRIGIITDGSLEAVITLFGAVLADMSVVLLDENAPEELLREQIRGADVDQLWGDLELVEALTPAITTGAPGAGGDILLFTSGTTESAKAVVLTQESLCTAAWNGSAKLPLTREDVLLCMLPLHHCFGLVCGLLWGLSCGAAVALGRGARHYHDDCAFFAPTAVAVVPMLLAFLLRSRSVNMEMRLVLVGAGGCAPELLKAAEDLGLHVSFGYGLTETSSGIALSVEEGGDLYAMEVCPDYTVTIAGDGEVLVRAPGAMMKGYYKRPGETDEVLKDGVLHTGDLGCLDENGRLRLTGRKKETLVLSDGTKIFLPEYEHQIAALLGERDLCVVERDGAPVLILMGEESEREAIVNTLAPLMETKPRSQQLRDVRFTHAPLPRTAVGKVKRWELLEAL